MHQPRLTRYHQQTLHVADRSGSQKVVGYVSYARGADEVEEDESGDSAEG